MLDKLDQETMLQLQENGRMSYVGLASLLKVSERTARNRVNNLLNSGILRITAMPNLDALDYKFMGIMGIQVRLLDLRSVAEELAKHSNICYLANVTGRYDLIAMIVTRSSREYADFVETVISAIPSILRTETFVNLNIYKGHGTGLDTTELINNLDVSASKKY